ncbi:MAG TPA: long-chain fatty acid--CoA ligase [Candidatus Limnocylindria bacterium]
MSTPTAAAESAAPGAGRRMITDVEPLTIPQDLRAESLVDLVNRTVQRYPDKEALRWKLPRSARQMGGTDEEAEEAVQWRSTTYQETWRWVTEVAMGLKHLGIRDGDSVAIMSRTRPAWLTADIGAMSLGAVTCPIYPSSEAGQAAFVINNVKAKLIFVENLQQYNKIEKVRADCPTLEHVIVIDDHGRLPPMAVSFDDIFDLSEAEPGELREWEEHWRTFRRDKVATIVHTSGTTGDPKGVVLTHGNILLNFEAGIQAVDFNERDLFLSFLPLSHMTERAAGQVVPLGRGCTIAYAEPTISRLAANMVETEPTVMVAVPRLYETLYARVLSTVEAGPALNRRIFHWATKLGRQHYQNHLDGRRDSFWLGMQMKVADRLVFSKIRARTGGRVRYFVSGGAPLSREIGEFFYAMGMLILEGYGLTETAPLLTINRPGDFKFGTVGKPVAETQIKIDPATGEILARGPQVMKGYLNEPEETAKVIDADGWFHTGDIGELDEIGRVLITDRLKNIIVLANGKNVAPAPMEIALATSKYIAQAVILGDQQPYTGVLIAPDLEELGTWAAANGLAEAPPEQLIADDKVGKLFHAEVRSKLEDFAVYERPRRIALLPRLLSEEEGELTPSLKVKLRVVKDKWADKVGYLFDEDHESRD